MLCTCRDMLLCCCALCVSLLLLLLQRLEHLTHSHPSYHTIGAVRPRRSSYVGPAQSYPKRRFGSFCFFFVMHSLFFLYSAPSCSRVLLHVTVPSASPFCFPPSTSILSLLRYPPVTVCLCPCSLQSLPRIHNHTHTHTHIAVVVLISICSEEQ